MKETPILFKPEMIRAILSGQKTQTRRLIKPQPTYVSLKELPNKLFMWSWVTPKFSSFGGGGIGGLLKSLNCPYGRKGDLLWVKEAICEYGENVFYKLDYGALSPLSDGGGKWKSPLFMPKKYARLWLELTADPIPQRLQEITEEDVESEGCALQSWCADDWDMLPHTAGFASLIDKINGAGTWDKNPWIWKLKFKRVEK